jgi:hypothetical protein
MTSLTLDLNNESIESYLSGSWYLQRLETLNWNNLDPKITISMKQRIQKLVKNVIFVPIYNPNLKFLPIFIVKNPRKVTVNIHKLAKLLESNEIDDLTLNRWIVAYLAAKLYIYSQFYSTSEPLDLAIAHTRSRFMTDSLLEAVITVLTNMLAGQQSWEKNLPLDTILLAPEKILGENIIRRILRPAEHNIAREISKLLKELALLIESRNFEQAIKILDILELKLGIITRLLLLASSIPNFKVPGIGAGTLEAMQTKCYSYLEQLWSGLYAQDAPKAWKNLENLSYLVEMLLSEYQSMIEEFNKMSLNQRIELLEKTLEILTVNRHKSSLAEIYYSLVVWFSRGIILEYYRFIEKPIELIKSIEETLSLNNFEKFSKVLFINALLKEY